MFIAMVYDTFFYLQGIFGDEGRYYPPKPTPKAWWSFHTSSPKAQSGNNTNIHLVIGNYQLPNSCLD